MRKTALAVLIALLCAASVNAQGRSYKEIKHFLTEAALLATPCPVGPSNRPDNRVLALAVDTLTLWHCDFAGPAWQAVAGGGGGSFTFSISDGTTTQIINSGDVVNFADGFDIDASVSFPDTVTHDSTLQPGDFAGQQRVWNGASWVNGPLSMPAASFPLPGNTGAEIWVSDTLPGESRCVDNGTAWLLDIGPGPCPAGSAAAGAGQQLMWDGSAWVMGPISYACAGRPAAGNRGAEVWITDTLPGPSRYVDNGTAWILDIGPGGC